MMESLTSGRVKKAIFLLFGFLLLIFAYRYHDDVSPASLHVTGDGSVTRTASHKDFSHDFKFKEREVKIDDRILKFLLSNSQDVLSSKNEFEGDICSGFLTDPYYRRLMDGYLKAWYKFVPPQSKMDSSNCWYVRNFNTLPINITRRMTSVHRFVNTPSDNDIDMIFGKMFSSGNRIVISTQPTRHHFCLPSTYLLGFAKAGSSLLYEYIRAHPLLAEPHSKEGHLWRDLMGVYDPKHQEFQVLLYLYHYFDASRQIKDNPDMFSIDASPSGVFATSKPVKIGEKDICLVPLMIFKTLPNVKLLIQTRNPIDRLWSDFFFFCSPKRWNAKLKELEKTPLVAASLFHNYTVIALQEFRACIESGYTQFHCTALAGSYRGSEVSCRKVRVGMSMYYVHLIKWFSVFPREQLHVTRLEDTASDPSSTMNKVWDFLGVPPEAKLQTTGKKVNANKWRKDFKMFPETRKLLGEFFSPYNIKLAELLDDKRYLWNETLA